MDILETFKAGGPVMYLMLLGSFCVTVIMIERFMFYRHAERGMRSFVEQLPLLLEGRNWWDIYESIKNEDSAPAYVAVEGVKAMAEGRDSELALDVAYNTAAAELRTRLNYLSVLVTLSPLLGLLGTIIGMISSFNIFNLQAGQPMAITGGIGEALIATATGLCVAIFALVVHSYFAQKMDVILTAVEQAQAIVTSEARKRGR